MSVIKNLKKITKNEHVYKMTDENNPYVTKEYVSTECYVLNALIGNGDIFGGLAKGKRVAFAGPSSTGKSLLTAYVAKNYLVNKPTAQLIAFESEGATFRDMMKSVAVDEERVNIVAVRSVEDFRSQITKLIAAIKEERDSGEFVEYIFLLDSLGMMGTEKETNDAIEGKLAADFTRAKTIRSIFRIISLDISILEIPFLIVNHSYETMCVAEDTLILTKNGFKKIKEIQIGEQVKSLNGFQNVSHVYGPNDLNGKDKEFLKLTFDDGTEVRCTGDHKFLMKNNEWKEAGKIDLGEEFM